MMLGYLLCILLSVSEGYTILPHSVSLINKRNIITFDNNNIIKHNKYDTNLEKINSILSEKNKYGFLSTISVNKITKDFPYGSIVGYSIDEDKKPIFCFSNLSSHTKNIQNNSKTSLVITENNFSGLQNFRFTITGNIIKKNKNEFYDVYYKDHPDEFWINYEDFEIYKMETVNEISFVGGFANAGKIRLKDYFKN